MITTYPYPVWGTQGGGLARRSGDNYIFVEAPDTSTGLDVGDFVPDEWGLVPANLPAKEEMDQDDEDDDYLIGFLIAQTAIFN